MVHSGKHTLSSIRIAMLEQLSQGRAASPQPGDTWTNTSISQRNDNSVSVSGGPTSQGAPSIGGGLLAIGGLLLFALVGGLFVLRARKKLFAPESDTHSTGLLLDDMRAMLKRGEISQEEFDAARKSLAAKMKAVHGLAHDVSKKSGSL